jgi:hypothetical protein
MVEVFMDECQKLRTDFDYASMKFQENQAQLFLDRDYFLNLKKLLDELYALKTSKDPEYSLYVRKVVCRTNTSI